VTSNLERLLPTLQRRRSANLRVGNGSKHQPLGPPRAAVPRGNRAWCLDCWTQGARLVGMSAVRRSDESCLRPTADIRGRGPGGRNRLAADCRSTLCERQLGTGSPPFVEVLSARLSPRLRNRCPRTCQDAVFHWLRTISPFTQPPHTQDYWRPLLRTHSVRRAFPRRHTSRYSGAEVRR
jgi:hypothetical protein